MKKHLRSGINKMFGKGFGMLLFYARLDVRLCNAVRGDRITVIMPQHPIFSER